MIIMKINKKVMGEMAKRTDRHRSWVSGGLFNGIRIKISY